jgi:hypothetical protein
MDYSKLDQNLARLADTFPPHWYRLYAGCVEAGFTDEQAMEILKVYINSAIQFEPGDD